jgi:hypothetical protein
LGHDITSIGQFIETKFSPTNTLQGKISKFINNKSWVQTRLGVPLRILIFFNLGMVKKLFLKKSHIVFLFLFFLLVQHLDTSPRLIFGLSLMHTMFFCDHLYDTFVYFDLIMKERLTWNTLWNIKV